MFYIFIYTVWVECDKTKQGHTLIELKNVTKSYKKFCAIKDISFTVPSKSITALVGLNGAGKTTLLKTIAGIHYPDSGTIRVNGIDILQHPIKNKQQIGFVQDNNGFYPDYTVYEILQSDAAISLAKNVAKSNIIKVLDICSLNDVQYKNIRTLSKGYMQRLSFARALLHNPSVLLLDEPTSGLDPQQIIEMRNIIKSLSKEATILISTHLMQEVEALCSSIAIIHKGSLVAHGTEKELCTLSHTKTIEESFLHFTSVTEASK